MQKQKDRVALAEFDIGDVMATDRDPFLGPRLETMRLHHKRSIGGGRRCYCATIVTDHHYHQHDRRRNLDATA